MFQFPFFSCRILNSILFFSIWQFYFKYRVSSALFSMAIESIDIPLEIPKYFVEIENGVQAKRKFFIHYWQMPWKRRLWTDSCVSLQMASDLNDCGAMVEDLFLWLCWWGHKSLKNASKCMMIWMAYNINVSMRLMACFVFPNVHVFHMHWKTDAHAHGENIWKNRPKKNVSMKWVKFLVRFKITGNFWKKKLMKINIWAAHVLRYVCFGIFFVLRQEGFCFL